MQSVVTFSCTCCFWCSSMFLYELVFHSSFCRVVFYSMDIHYILLIPKLMNICLCVYICVYSLLYLFTYRFQFSSFFSVDLCYRMLSFSFSLRASFSICFRSRLLPTILFIRECLSHLHFQRAVFLDIHFLAEFYRNTLNTLFHYLLVSLVLMKKQSLIISLFSWTELFFHWCFQDFLFVFQKSDCVPSCSSLCLSYLALRVLDL